MIISLTLNHLRLPNEIGTRIKKVVQIFTFSTDSVHMSEAREARASIFIELISCGLRNPYVHDVLRPHVCVHVYPPIRYVNGYLVLALCEERNGYPRVT